jgi:hypothetical protein
MQFGMSMGRICIGVFSLVSMFTIGAFAQDCETYDLHGAVTSEQGKPITGALVDLLDYESRKPIKSDRWGKPMAKVVSSRDGIYGISVINLPNYSQQGSKVAYLLRVTAAGFTTYERRVDIELCGFKLDIKLTKTKRPVGRVEKKK